MQFKPKRFIPPWPRGARPGIEAISADCALGWCWLAGEEGLRKGNVGLPDSVELRLEVWCKWGGLSNTGGKEWEERGRAAQGVPAQVHCRFLRLVLKIEDACCLGRTGVFACVCARACEYICVCACDCTLSNAPLWPYRVRLCMQQL